MNDKNTVFEVLKKFCDKTFYRRDLGEDRHKLNDSLKTSYMDRTNVIAIQFHDKELQKWFIINYDSGISHVSKKGNNFVKSIEKTILDSEIGFTLFSSFYLEKIALLFDGEVLNVEILSSKDTPIVFNFFNLKNESRDKLLFSIMLAPRVE